MAHDNSLVLYLIHFDEDLRKEDDLKLPDESLENYKISDREMKMAIDLIKDLSGKGEPEKYHDEYREAMTKWLDQKTTEIAKQTGKKKTTKRRAPDDVVDFISLLKKSMGKKGKKTTANSRKSASS